MPDLKITASVKAASPPASARAHAAAEDGVDPANFAALLLEQVDGPSARTSGDGDAAAGLPGASTGAGTGAGKRDKASPAHDLALVAGGALPPVAASSASLPVQAPAAGSVPSSIDRSRAVPPDSTAGMAGSTAGSGVADAGPGAPRQTRFVELSPAAGYARPGEPGAFQVDAADESRAGADSAAGTGLPSPGSDVPRARAGQAPPHENASVAGAPAVRPAAAGSAAAAAAPPSSLPWSPAGDAVPDSTLRVA